MKTIKYFLILGILTIFIAPMLMGIYTLSPTFPKPTEWGGGIWKFSHTFVAATDTAYMPFSPPRPKGGADTVAVIVDCGAAPDGQTGTGDTVKVYFGYQWSDDNTNWSALTAIGTDSTKTGTDEVYTWTQFRLGFYTSTGIHPYYRIVAIGQTTSGGATNIIGNKILVFLLRQYNY
jgi:hypothetical protein